MVRGLNPTFFCVLATDIFWRGSQFLDKFQGLISKLQFRCFKFSSVQCLAPRMTPSLVSHCRNKRRGYQVCCFD